MKGDGGVAGEGRVVGVPKFHSWGRYTMQLTNINSDWMSNASSGLWFNLFMLRGSIISLAEHCLQFWPGLPKYFVATASNCQSVMKMFEG